MRGRAIRLSVQRRMIIDLLYFATGIPTVPVQKRMSLGPLLAARAACHERPRWTAIFTKAYAVVAQEYPELRQVYVKLPWPQLYEYPTSTAKILIERDYRGSRPSAQFRSKTRHTNRYATSHPGSSTLQLRRSKKLRTFADGRNSRDCRVFCGARFGGWGSIGAANAVTISGLSDYLCTRPSKPKSLHPLAPSTTVLNYGVMTGEGVLDVRIIYDHRVMNGTTVARVLVRLEEILNSVMVEEVRSLAKAA